MNRMSILHCQKVDNITVLYTESLAGAHFLSVDVADVCAQLLDMYSEALVAGCEGQLLFGTSFVPDPGDGLSSQNFLDPVWKQDVRMSFVQASQEAPARHFPCSTHSFDAVRSVDTTPERCIDAVHATKVTQQDPRPLVYQSTLQCPVLTRCHPMTTDSYKKKVPEKAISSRPVTRVLVSVHPFLHRMHEDCVRVQDVQRHACLLQLVQVCWRFRDLPLYSLHEVPKRRGRNTWSYSHGHHTFGWRNHGNIRKGIDENSCSVVLFVLPKVIALARARLSQRRGELLVKVRVYVSPYSSLLQEIGKMMEKEGLPGSRSWARHASLLWWKWKAKVISLDNTLLISITCSLIPFKETALLFTV